MLWSAASALRARIRSDTSAERCAGRKNLREEKLECYLAERIWAGRFRLGCNNSYVAG